MSGSIDQCSCNKITFTNDVFNSVAKESSFKHQKRDLITSLTTNLVLKTSFPFRVKLKKLLGEDCLKVENKIFTVFRCKKLRWKISKWQLFLFTQHPPLFTECN